MSNPLDSIGFNLSLQEPEPGVTAVGFHIQSGLSHFVVILSPEGCRLAAAKLPVALRTAADDADKANRRDSGLVVAPADALSKIGRKK